MTIDNFITRGMTYAEYMKKKKEAEAKEATSVVKKYDDLKIILDEEDLLLLSRLVDYFYEEVPQRLYNDFLRDHSYSDHEFLRVMGKLRRSVK